MRNTDIREASKVANVKLWKIAERLGVTDATFSRKLRKELSENEKQEIISIIQELEGGERNE